MKRDCKYYVGAPEGAPCLFPQITIDIEFTSFTNNVCRKVFLGGFGHIAKIDARRPTKSRNIGHRNCIFVYMPISVKQGDRLASKMGIRVWFYCIDPKDLKGEAER